ncbi:MAG: iron ABC transporter permease [Bacteroidia bacterium]|nr:iron ABC transporter permease [Bacteroidia bacterium]
MKLKYGILFLLVVFLFAMFCSIFYGGSGALSWSEVNSANFIFWEIRLPKTLTAILAGFALPTAGLLLQVLFRNPLAGPYALGISSGASLMVAVSLLATQSIGLGLFFGKSVLIASALSGSFAVTLLLLAISSRVRSNVVVLLIGLMISQICGALLGTLEYYAEPGNLKNFVLWGMGSFSGTNYKDLFILLLFILMSFVMLLFSIKPLNALLLGDEYARSLGFNISRTRFFLILISSLLTGICTAFCGPVAFVGISVPILSRILFQTSRQEWHLLSGVLMGSSLLLFADALSHNLIPDSSLPVNIITTLLGAPVVLYLMFKTKQW